MTCDSLQKELVKRIPYKENKVPYVQYNYYYQFNCKNETVLGEKDNGKATKTITNISLKPAKIQG